MFDDAFHSSSPSCMEGSYRSTAWIRYEDWDAVGRLDA
jgi:hypothetical protein